MEEKEFIAVIADARTIIDGRHTELLSSGRDRTFPAGARWRYLHFPIRKVARKMHRNATIA